MSSSSIQIFKKYIKPQFCSSIPTIKYKTNFTNCILDAFQYRGYQKTIEDDWDVIWSQKDGLNQIYQKRLLPNQKINHFRNYYEMCKKDNLIKNLKKHKKTLDKQGKTQQAKDYNFFPQTFILPSEYFLFAQQFKKNQNASGQNVWIMKPIGKSQGKGIFLINKLNQLSAWQSNTSQQTEPYIVQRYINNPLLIGGKKFDLRIYVLVTSYSPLTIYLYRNGFARFTHARYDQTKIHQTQIHLTNVAIQKNSQNYDQNIGGKWYLDRLKTYMLSEYGEQSTNQTFLKIQNIIIKTLQSMVKIIASDRQNSFQLYGFDIMLDNILNPWLIQVNGSPSMTANTPKDKLLKNSLLDDTLTVLNLQKFLNGDQQQIGGFDLICKKNPKNNNISLLDKQKMSFLGTQINRQDNYKKLAKINSNRINDSKNQQSKKKDLILTPNVPKATEKRRVMSQSNNQNKILPLNTPGTQVNKKHLNLGTNLGSNNLASTNLGGANLTANLGGSRRVITPILPKQGKDFVIKQKHPSFNTKRQKTNQNDYVK